MCDQSAKWMAHCNDASARPYFRAHYSSRPSAFVKGVYGPVYDSMALGFLPAPPFASQSSSLNPPLQSINPLVCPLILHNRPVPRTHHRTLISHPSKDMKTMTISVATQTSLRLLPRLS